jgi:tetratricopeptide (TPR) repeat protein
MNYTKRADLLMKSKKPRAAIADCKAALEINPDSAKAYRISGLAYRRTHQWDEARKALAQVGRSYCNSLLLFIFIVGGQEGAGSGRSVLI